MRENVRINTCREKHEENVHTFETKKSREREKSTNSRRDSRFSGLGLLCLRRDILCALPSPVQRGHVALRRCGVVTMMMTMRSQGVKMDGQTIRDTASHTCDSVDEEEEQEGEEE